MLKTFNLKTCRTVKDWNLRVCLQKCVLYWPEKRGIYGKVEVLVNSIRECEHYTTRSLTLKVCPPFSCRATTLTASGLGTSSLVCLSSVGTKPVSCSITGTRRGLTTKLRTLRCRCCSSWVMSRQRDVPPPPPPRVLLLSTAGTDARFVSTAHQMSENAPSFVFLLLVVLALAGRDASLLRR